MKGYRIKINGNALLAASILLTVLICIAFWGGGSKPENDSLPITVTPVRTTEAGNHSITVYDTASGTSYEMDLEAYILGVVAGEMPASYSEEALKAQAVAARSFAVYGIVSGGCKSHAGCDVCTEYSCCQAYCTNEEMQSIWGADYDAYYSKLEAAVRDTAGLVLTYEGQPIQVFFYASGNGWSEASEEVFSASLPYYQTVASMDTLVYTVTELPYAEFIDQFKAFYPNAVLSADSLPNQITILSYTTGKRVKQLTVGGITLSGRDFRSIFGLKSADFELSFDSGKVSVTAYGYGHGVGLSQNGANAMAEAGSGFEEILAHFYVGTELTPVDKLLP